MFSLDSYSVICSGVQKGAKKILLAVIKPSMHIHTGLNYTVTS